MNEIVTVAIVACIVVGLVSTGYGIGLVCSWWDCKRQAKRYRHQRKG